MNKETVAALIQNVEASDKGYIEYVVKQLSQELSDKLITILDKEGEVIVKQSKVRVREYPSTDSLEYRRQIEWTPIVRCKECEFYNADEKWCSRLGLCGAFNENDFCSHGERRESK